MFSEKCTKLHLCSPFLCGHPLKWQNLRMTQWQMANGKTYGWPISIWQISVTIVDTCFVKHELCFTFRVNGTSSTSLGYEYLQIHMHNPHTQEPATLSKWEKNQHLRFTFTLVSRWVAKCMTKRIVFLRGHLQITNLTLTRTTILLGMDPRDKQPYTASTHMYKPQDIIVAGTHLYTKRNTSTR